MIVRGPIQRLSSVPALAGVTPSANQLISLAYPYQSRVRPSRISTRWYLGGPDGSSATSTNTNTLTTNTLYSTLWFNPIATTINNLGTRTSSSNASVGASIKLGIYSVNDAITTATRLGTTGSISVTDSGTNTSLTGSLGGNVIIPAGWVITAVIPTAVTTACRLMTFSSMSPFLAEIGGSSNANVLSLTLPAGYTTTGGTFAAGPPSTIDLTTSTEVTAVTNLPPITMQVA